MGMRTDEISLRVFNSTTYKWVHAAHSWAIESNTWTEIPYLREPMYDSLHNIVNRWVLIKILIWKA